MIVPTGPYITAQVLFNVKNILVRAYSRNGRRRKIAYFKPFLLFYLVNARRKTTGPYHSWRNLTQRQKDMILIIRHRVKRAKEGTPFSSIGLIKTNTITGCKPKVTITILHHIMDLIIHQ